VKRDGAGWKGQRNVMEQVGRVNGKWWSRSEGSAERDGAGRKGQWNVMEQVERVSGT
jgi:hypothetical protein